MNRTICECDKDYVCSIWTSTSQMQEEKHESFHYLSGKRNMSWRELYIIKKSFKRKQNIENRSKKVMYNNVLNLIEIDRNIDIFEVEENNKEHKIYLDVDEI